MSPRKRVAERRQEKFDAAMVKVREAMWAFGELHEEVYALRLRGEAAEVAERTASHLDDFYQHLSDMDLNESGVDFWW